MMMMMMMMVRQRALYKFITTKPTHTHYRTSLQTFQAAQHN